MHRQEVLWLHVAQHLLQLILHSGTGMHNRSEVSQSGSAQWMCAICWSGLEASPQQHHCTVARLAVLRDHHSHCAQSQHVVARGRSVQASAVWRCCLWAVITTLDVLKHVSQVAHLVCMATSVQVLATPLRNLAMYEYSSSATKAHERHSTNFASNVCASGMATASDRCGSICRSLSACT